MEDIMNGSQLRRKTNSVSHWATDFKDFGRRYAEIDKIPYLELQGFSSLVCITFLSRLGCLKVGLDNLDLVFGFGN
jgi:hypothetical protein